MKRLNKILAALQKFASKDYTYRYLNGILFDLDSRVIEVTDGHAGIVIKGSRGFIAGMANDYAEHLGIDPVGGDFGAVRLAPKNGRRYPHAEKLGNDSIPHVNLSRLLRFGEHDPEMCKLAHVHADQLPRLNKFCKAVGTGLHLVPGTSKIAATMQYGKGTYNGDEFAFCIAQMPCISELFYEDGSPATETVIYSPLDEREREAMKQFMAG